MNRTLEGLRKGLQRASISLRGMQETSDVRYLQAPGYRETHTHSTHTEEPGVPVRKPYIPGSPYCSNLIPK